MQKNNQSKIYGKVAAVYEHLMRNVDYSAWAEYLYSIVEEYLPADPAVLEFGAGNGKLANHFFNYYDNIVVSDISAEMLSRNSSNLFPKICCDMKAVPFKNKFDLIYSTFDSVNYLTSKKELTEFFKQVYNILSDCGIFTFDASLLKNSYKHIKIPERKGKIDGIEYFQKSEFNRKIKVHKNTFSIKFGENDIYTEIHRQKIYDFEDYFILLEKANLYVADCLRTFTYDQATANTDRVQFIVKKAA